MSPSITFYSIPSSLPGSFSPSPNCWKIGYALNFKKLEYKTVFVEFPDIKQLYEKFGLPAAFSEADGTPYYTLPLIHDSSTGAVVPDSVAIAKYLDATYPDTPRLYPLGDNTESHVLHDVFGDAFHAKLGSLYQFGLPAMHGRLNPASQPFFRNYREGQFGVTLEALNPRGDRRREEWAKVKASFGEVAKWFGGNTFVTGDRLSFADMQIAGWVLWLRTGYGSESEEWKDMAEWDEGRWGKLLEALKPYEVVSIA